MSGKLRSIFVALAALVLISFGAAHAATFSVNMKPPAFAGNVTTVQGLGTTSNYTANADGSFTITDGQTYQSLLDRGWRVLQVSSRNGGSSAVVSAVSPVFIPFDGLGAGQLTLEGDVTSVMPLVATLSNLKCVSVNTTATPTGPGTGSTYIISVDQNGVAGALTCTISGTGTSCTDTTHTMTAAVGDQFDYLVTPLATPAPVATVIKCSVQVAS